MIDAHDIFVIELARASRRARKFIRHLAKADREEVLQGALLWCWENRESYSLTTSLSTWFVNAVRVAYRSWRRGELRNAATEIVSDMRASDNVERAVELEQAVAVMATNMDEMDERIFQLRLAGKTHAQIADECRLDRSEVSRRLARLRSMLPPAAASAPTFAQAVTRELDIAVTWSRIDQEIEQLDFAPPPGAECPPCWRCKWFEGYLPGAHKSARMTVVEPEVRDAIRDTEARKIEIATRVRAGEL